MRVLYFTEKDSPHDQRFLRALAGSPHQVFALRQMACKPDTPDGIFEVQWPGIRPDWSDWQGWQQGKKQFIELLAEINPDVVHAGPIQGPALVAALSGFHPLVSMSWGSDLLLKATRSPWKREATQCTLAHSDILIADCQTVADAAAGLGFPVNRIVQFPWGVDLDLFSPESGVQAGKKIRQSIGWENEFVIFCNRAWSSLYGVDVLAHAFVRAFQENDNLRLLLVGDGPQAGEIHRILSPVKEVVRFPGWIEPSSLPDFYHASDLFVSPSHSDGTSISLLEAMACGKPVLVSDIPSNREWVTPKYTGNLFADGSVSELKEKLLSMASEPRLEEYGRQARQLAEKCANWQENFAKLLTAYQMAVDIAQ